jgi:hypothetical protein
MPLINSGAATRSKEGKILPDERFLLATAAMQ